MTNLHRPLLLASLALFTQAAAAQAVHLVGPGGLPTIQAAIDAAAPLDIVLVDAGVYPAFDVGKPLVITAMPSALVQVVATQAVTVHLQAAQRLHLAGLDLQVGGVLVEGGIFSMERCTVRTQRGVHVTNGVASLRWSSAGAARGSGLSLHDAHLHASDCTFSTAASGVSDIEHGAVRLSGTSFTQLSLCTLIGAWPLDANAPWPSVALHESRAAAGSRSWLSDCTLLGGYHPTGPLGPSLVAAPFPAPARVRLHRTQVIGLAIGEVTTGSVVGLHTPADMQIGTTFTTTMRGEPGHSLLLYAGSDVLGPFPLSFVEQFAFGFFDTVILGTLPANAMGTADFPLAVPNAPSLRHLVLWWRGLDVSVAPWQASPVFVTVVQ